MVDEINTSKNGGGISDNDNSLEESFAIRRSPIKLKPKRQESVGINNDLEHLIHIGYNASV